MTLLSCRKTLVKLVVHGKCLDFAFDVGNTKKFKKFKKAVDWDVNFFLTHDPNDSKSAF